MTGWLHLHARAFLQAVKRLALQPVGTLLSALVVGIALSLPAAGYLMLDNVTTLARGVSGTPEISIFMVQQASPQDVAAIERRLQGNGDVASYVHVSREEALRQLERGGLGDVLGGLTTNPLPEAFVVIPRGEDPALYETLQGRFSEWDAESSTSSSIRRGSSACMRWWGLENRRYCCWRCCSASRW